MLATCMRGAHWSSMRIPALLTASLYWVGVVHAAEPVELPERQFRQAGEFVIEYSPGDNAYADDLAHRLATLTFEALPEDSMLADMEQRRDWYLEQVVDFLALVDGQKEIADLYDRFLTMFQSTSRLLRTPIRRYALWRRPELALRLERGEKFPGFSGTGPTGITFSINFHSSGTGSGQEVAADTEDRLRESWTDMTWPISIRREGGGSPPEEIEAGLKMMDGARRGMLHSVLSPFILMHETVEVGLVKTYISSKDRRWFCDGVAHYVAWRIVEKAYGPARARIFYDLEADLLRHASVIERIDLESWPVGEDIKTPGAPVYPDELSTANYAYAAKVIAEVCAKHGDDLLPRLFAEIGKTSRDETTMETVYAAFTALTGEDLRSYLPNSVQK